MKLLQPLWGLILFAECIFRFDETAVGIYDILFRSAV